MSVDSICSLWWSDETSNRAFDCVVFHAGVLVPVYKVGSYVSVTSKVFEIHEYADFVVAGNVCATFTLN